MKTTAPLPLEGMGIVVTRPVHQAEHLCRLIENWGGEAIRYPTLEILPPRTPDTISSIAQDLGKYDMAIFTSANAVHRGLRPILKQRSLPPRLRLMAIGRATAQALSQYGIAVPRLPQGEFSSEALLNMPEMQTVTGLAIIIFRGEGGRELLAQALKNRGAAVTYGEVYRRGKPKTPPDLLLAGWKQRKIQAVVVTSNESLRNLFDLVGENGQQWLRDTPLVVISNRTRDLAYKLGFKHASTVAGEASDEAIIEALLSMTPSPTQVTFGDLQ